MLMFQFEAKDRFGLRSMYREPALLPKLTDEGTTGKAPCGRLPALVCRENGRVRESPMVLTYGSGSTEKIPNPPRIAALPLPDASHEKPIRGSKFRVVGLLART